MRGLGFVSVFGSLLLFACEGERERDFGNGRSDNGIPPVDSGVPPVDTGVVPPDTGVVPADTGVVPDAEPAEIGVFDSGVDFDGGFASQFNCSEETLAMTVAINYVAETAPTPEGGPFIDGVYVLIGGAVYTGPGGTPGPFGTLGGRYEMASGDFKLVLGTDAAQARAAGRLTVNGSNVTFEAACGVFAELFEMAGYDSDGIQLSLFVTNTENGNVSVFRFERT